LIWIKLGFPDWKEPCPRETGKGGGSMQQLSGHIAIVDDDAPFREVLARLLRVQGINSRSYPSALVSIRASMTYCFERRNRFSV
jgi:hypothetical protein